MNLVCTWARKVYVSQTPLIMCVEDDASVREAIKGLLVSLGFAAEVFSSAEEFIQSSRLSETSCLITDVQLGGMSGIELQNRLAALGHCIPTIVITAFPDERIRAQALSAGAVCFLYKPINKDEFVNCIDSALNRRSDVAEPGPGEGQQ
jgi:FixJ family two-component response regulator